MISEIVSKVDEIKKSEGINEGTLFFLSFDLVNSTKFKALEPKKWIKKIKEFYLLVEKQINTISNEAHIWKKQGDEVLIYFKFNKIDDLYTSFKNINSILNNLIEKVKEAEGKSLLSVKSTFWTALVSSEHTETTVNLATDSPTGKYDFIGPDIDFGFRIAGKNAGGMICVDPKIIAMMFKSLPEHCDLKFISEFKIIDFVQLKGIWNNRFVPIIWYHPQIEKPNGIFPYDEEQNNEFVRRLLNGNVRKITNVYKIFQDLDKTEMIEKLISCIDKFDINTAKAPANRTAEVHIAAVLFNEELTEVFCAKRAANKNIMPSLWENGCCQLRLGRESIEDIVKKYYEEEFDIKIIKFKINDQIGYQSLNVIGTYSFVNNFEKTIPGFIITGIAKKTEKDIFNPTKHSEIKWMTIDDIKNIKDAAVEGFKERILLAHQLWQKGSLEQTSDKH